MKTPKTKIENFKFYNDKKYSYRYNIFYICSLKIKRNYLQISLQ